MSYIKSIKNIPFYKVVKMGGNFVNYIKHFETNGDEISFKQRYHDYGMPTYTWSEDGNTCVAKRVCKDNSNHVETENGTITSIVKTNATCTECGITTYTSTFTNMTFKTQTKDVVDVPAIGHNLVAGKCTRCDYKEAGLYDTNGKLIATFTKEDFDGTGSNAKTLLNSYPTTTKVVLPQEVTDIPNGLFVNRTNLTSIILSDNLTTIKANAFYNCKGLISIIIPDNITSINANAFMYCTNLKTITLSKNLTLIGQTAFAGTSLESIEIPNKVTTIGAGAFRGCSKLTSIIIPDSVVKLSNAAFSNCTSLESVELPNNITNIEEEMFENCTKLTSFTIPDTVISIETYAFSGCTGLTSITIPNSVTTIGSDAFKNVAHVYYTGSATGSPWGAKVIN